MTKALTRTRILDVAVDRFGLEGLDQVSTRAIADAARVPMSAITCHFKSKDGLYQACAEHIAADISAWMAPVVVPPIAGLTGEEASARIGQIIDSLAAIMLQMTPRRSRCSSCASR